jgi:3',5'-cyclic AMP phosphodiesterase CpdA
MTVETTIFLKKILFGIGDYIKTMARIISLFISLCIFMNLTSCKGRSIGRNTEHLRFALIGNTNPESPFQKVSERVRKTFKVINEDNPIFIVHLGDIVYGGKEWMGIKRKDISLQYNQFFKYASTLNPILYTVKGEMDLYNDSSELYRVYSGREDYYSFNYGNLHFVILDTTDDTPGEMSKEQLIWLENDLTAYRDAHVFVFTHHPIAIPRRNQSNADKSIFQEPDKLHTILNKYPIKAVFSGHWSSYNLEKRDNIIYYITGCGGFNKPDRYKKYNNYYIVDYSRGSIKITAKRAPYDNR